MDPAAAGTSASGGDEDDGRSHTASTENTTEGRAGVQANAAEDEVGGTLRADGTRRPVRRIRRGFVDPAKVKKYVVPGRRGAEEPAASSAPPGITPKPNDTNSSSHASSSTDTSSVLGRDALGNVQHVPTRVLLCWRPPRDNPASDGPSPLVVVAQHPFTGALSLVPLPPRVPDDGESGADEQAAAGGLLSSTSDAAADSLANYALRFFMANAGVNMALDGVRHSLAACRGEWVVCAGERVLVVTVDQPQVLAELAGGGSVDVGLRAEFPQSQLRVYPLSLGPQPFSLADVAREVRGLHVSSGGRGGGIERVNHGPLLTLAGLGHTDAPLLAACEAELRRWLGSRAGEEGSRMSRDCTGLLSNIPMPQPAPRADVRTAVIEFAPHCRPPSSRHPPLDSDALRCGVVQHVDLVVRATVAEHEAVVMGCPAGSVRLGGTSHAVPHDTPKGDDESVVASLARLACVHFCRSIGGGEPAIEYNDGNVVLGGSIVRAARRVDGTMLFETHLGIFSTRAELAEAVRRLYAPTDAPARTSAGWSVVLLPRGGGMERTWVRRLVRAVDTAPSKGALLVHLALMLAASPWCVDPSVLCDAICDRVAWCNDAVDHCFPGSTPRDAAVSDGGRGQGRVGGRFGAQAGRGGRRGDGRDGDRGRRHGGGEDTSRDGGSSQRGSGRRGGHCNGGRSRGRGRGRDGTDWRSN